ncbi:hypothetical protein Rhe02_84600 [Rhizocola hellebori]|uniref:Uncharacterized protein n=1 Tax=Rhizocola hellebori TaxID=1392758 RepID=A0A8J3VLQ3_9ACTN|nr:hypothetical protein Rhe02_84600 [Rhizocola hellebori]
MLLLASFGFVAVGILLIGRNPVVSVLCFLLGGLYLVPRGITLVRRRTMLRVDAQGVLLGGPSTFSRDKDELVSWQDIVAVVLWEQEATRGRKMAFVGLQRHEGLPQLKGSARSKRWQRIALATVPAHVPRQVAIDSRPVNLWSLDRGKLATAVRAFAPEVPIADLATK